MRSRSESNRALSAGRSSETPRPRVSLSGALGGHKNSLGLLRLVLASLVIVDHAFHLGGFGNDPLTDLSHGQASIGSVAVLGFFAISGYLITKSGMSTDAVQFIWRRALRIFPAYWLVLVVTAMLIAPVIWTVGGNVLADYYTVAGNGPLGYIAKNWTLGIGAYGIYDLLAETTPYGLSVGASVFNGSLWTLSYEWQCYLIVGILVLFGMIPRVRAVIPGLMVCAGLIQLWYLVDPDLLSEFAPLFANQQLLELTFTFLVGATLGAYADKIPFDDRLGVFAGGIVLVTLAFGGFATVGTVAGAYVVMYLGARLPAGLQWIGARNDYSYGVYIYGFLVQQVMAYFGWYRLGYFLYVLVALVLAFAFAWLSWHVIEKRAMALKNWGPGHGVRYWMAQWATRVSKRTVGE